MDTFSHGFWSYFIFRNFKKKVIYIVIGSIFPDLIFFLNFFYLFISDIWFRREYIIELLYEWYHYGTLPREKIAQFFFITTDNPNIVKITKYATHSIVVWLFALFIFWIFFRHENFFKYFLLGWYIHIFEDLFTHVEDASPIFWPLDNTLYKGIISYWDPQYFGETFNFVNKVLLIIAIIFLIYLRYKK